MLTPEEAAELSKIIQNRAMTAAREAEAEVAEQFPLPKGLWEFILPGAGEQVQSILDIERQIGIAAGFLGVVKVLEDAGLIAPAEAWEAYYRTLDLSNEGEV